jgi:hypothetical protein
MGVGIHKAGDHAAPGRIYLPLGLEAGAQMRGCAYGDDAPILHGQRALLDDGEIAQILSPLGAAGVSDGAELGGGMEQQIDLLHGQTPFKLKITSGRS